MSMSALAGDETSKSRIRDAVPSGFNVTCKPIIEGRVSRDRYDQVVPAAELFYFRLHFKSMPGLENLRCCLARISVQNGDVNWTGRDVRDPQLDRALPIVSVTGNHIQRCS